MQKRIRVKYCGGCNPGYDRVAVAAKLRKEFPQVRVVETQEDATPNHFVAVICGCPAACASHDDLRGLYGKELITSEAEYEKLAARIRDMLS